MISKISSDFIVSKFSKYQIQAFKIIQSKKFSSKFSKFFSISEKFFKSQKIC